MSQPQRAETSKAAARRYRRPVVPLHFPVEETVPESTAHLELRTALYQILKLAMGDRATIGSDQFVYWDPTDPGKRLAPDLFVRLGPPHAMFGSWKVWERGAPQVAVEIISDSDESDRRWEEKLARYRHVGVEELVRFDPDDSNEPLRIWDRVDGDFVERALDDTRSAECAPLGLIWLVMDDKALRLALRLADKERRLLPTPTEAEASGREAAEQRARDAEARVRELEAIIHKKTTADR